MGFPGLCAVFSNALVMFTRILSIDDTTTTSLTVHYIGLEGFLYIQSQRPNHDKTRMESAQVYSTDFYVHPAGTPFPCHECPVAPPVSVFERQAGLIKYRAVLLFSISIFTTLHTNYTDPLLSDRSILFSLTLFCGCNVKV